jgi:hypothetical protein
MADMMADYAGINAAQILNSLPESTTSIPKRG